MKKASALFKKFPVLGFSAMMILLMGFEVLSSSCSKSDCPGFSDDNYDKWFPYNSNSGQPVYFISNLGNRDTFRISASRSEPHTTRGSSSNCGMNASINSYSSSRNAIQLSVDYAVYSGGKRIYMTVYELDLNGENIEDTGVKLIGDNRAMEQYFPSETLETQTFSKVQLIRRDTSTNKTPGIYKIWLAQQTGLVGFEYYPSQERFVKQ